MPVDGHETLDLEDVRVLDQVLVAVHREFLKDGVEESYLLEVE